MALLGAVIWNVNSHIATTGYKIHCIIIPHNSFVVPPQKNLSDLGHDPIVIHKKIKEFGAAVFELKFSMKCFTLS